MSHVKVEFAQLQEVGQTCSNVSGKILQATQEFQESMRGLDWQVRSKSNIESRARKLTHRLEGCRAALRSYSSFVNIVYSRYSELENYQCESEKKGNISQSINESSANSRFDLNNKKDDKVNQNTDTPESINYNTTEYLNEADNKYRDIEKEFYEYIKRIFREESKDLNSTTNKKKDEDLAKHVQAEVIEGENNLDDTDAKKAFLSVLQEWIEESKIKDYDYNENKDPFREWLSNIFGSKERREITINGITYNIEYDENSLPIAQGQGVATANVSWKDKDGEHCVKMQINLLDTKVSQEALAEFGVGLAKYGEEATKKAVKEFVKETSGGLVNSDFVVELAFALTDEKKAKEFCRTFADGVLENIEGRVEKSSVKFLKDFFSNIPGGEKIVGGAERIVEFKEKYDKITEKINGYGKKYDSVRAASEAEKSLKELEVLTNEFMAFMNS